MGKLSIEWPSTLKNDSDMAILRPQGGRQNSTDVVPNLLLKSLVTEKSVTYNGESS